MSGRKQGEVIAVLQQGERARQKTVNVHGGNIDKSKNDINLISRSVENKINALHISQPSSDAGKYYAQEVEEVLSEVASIKNKLKNLDIPVNQAQKLAAEFQPLLSKLKAVDREAEQIRRDIAHKYGGYCDAEYARAQRLVGEYNSIVSDMNSLARRLNNLEIQAKQEANKCERELKNLQAINNKIENINLLAENREKSNVIKENLRNTILKINEAEAEKFMSSEFHSLKEKVTVFCAADDRKVIAGSSLMMAAINEFLGALNAKVAQWQKEKKDAEDYYDQVNGVAEHSFVNPLDEVNEEENPQKYDLFTFIGKYTSKDFYTEYKALGQKIKALIAQEKFKDAMEVTKAMDSLMQQADSYALALQETMIKKTDLAATIMDVMYDLNYDVDSECIDGNPNNGFCVTCTVGDAEIKFDRIDVEEDGSVVIKIDHTEGTVGKCQNSWKVIVDELRKEGIPVSDIKMANGQSVLGQVKAIKKQEQIAKH